MEVEEVPASGSSQQLEAGCSVMAGPTFQPTVSVELHPLVIMNIADQWTRIRAQRDGNAEQVVGALLGKQEGRVIEVCNSFDLERETTDGDTINEEFFRKQAEQFKRVFPDNDVVGWYITGGRPDEVDVNLHKQMVSYHNDNIILLKLDPSMPEDGPLPVFAYESVIDMENKDATLLFGSVPCDLVTEEAERIGLDNMTRLSVQNTNVASLASQHLRTQHSAIKMLHSRVRIVQEYVKAVENGQLPPNWSILREIHSLTRQLPVVETQEFREDYYNQCNDVALQTFLGTVTKCCDSMNIFINQFNVLHGRQGTSMGRRMKRANI